MAPGRDRILTEDSFQSTSYMVLADEEGGEMSLTPVNDQRLRDSGHFMNDKIVTPIIRLDDHDDDDDLTPFLLSRHPTRLNGLNLLNVATYIMHLIVSYGVGVWGLDGLVDTRVAIAQKYETLVTPSPWAYYIWIPILMTETIFVTAQLFPDYRSRPIIQQGTSFFFFYTCLLQTGWTLFFAFKLFIFSFVCVVLVVISLASLLTSQHLTQTRGRASLEEFWLFRFPFCLHFAWMVVMAANDFAILIRYEFRHEMDTQLTSDIVAMGILLPVACFFMLRAEGPNFIVPGVILWSYVGMVTRLLHPSDKLLEDYGGMVVSAVRQSLYFFIGIVSFLLGPRIMVWFCNEYCTIRVINFNEEDGATLSRSSFWNGHR
ncbi:hypothetical protein MHU86_1763 [Fragilaria crotonensis]|nr:hypothetical protein MHU86_1763 [Fragilaria crotonensis]